MILMPKLGVFMAIMKNILLLSALMAPSYLCSMQYFSKTTSRKAAQSAGNQISTKISTNSSGQSTQGKKRWYQSKLFKRSMIYLFGINPILDNGSKIHQYNTVVSNTVDMKEADPELYDVCMSIKKDLKIVDDIQFRVIESDNNYFPEFLAGQTKPIRFLFPIEKTYTFVLINSNYKNQKNAKSVVIHIIAHELEHVRQLLCNQDTQKYSDSYDFKKTPLCWDDVKRNLKLETGADAASCDYQDCSVCLQAAQTRSEHEHNPKDTDLGYFTTSHGYFSKQDYDLWIKRAQENDALCPAHRNNKADDPNTPLKDFLPVAHGR